LDNAWESQFTAGAAGTGRNRLRKRHLRNNADGDAKRV